MKKYDSPECFYDDNKDKTIKIIKNETDIYIGKVFGWHITNDDILIKIVGSNCIEKCFNGESVKNKRRELGRGVAERLIGNDKYKWIELNDPSVKIEIADE